MFTVSNYAADITIPIIWPLFVLFSSQTTMIDAFIYFGDMKHSDTRFIEKKRVLAAVAVGEDTSVHRLSFKLSVSPSFLSQHRILCS